MVTPTVEDISTGGQRYLARPDGCILAAGYAPTKHTVKLTTTVDVGRITAFRLELLTDPNLPLGGPGRSFKGTNALTDFAVELGAPGSTAKPTRVTFAKAAADFGDAPDTPLERNFDDKSNKKRVTGPIGYAIDGKDETAWGIDAGPGRRNTPRTAVFTLATPIVRTTATQLVFLLKQDHGGWNSNDLMNNNLGRFRLSYTTAAVVPKADPLPAAVREILAVPRRHALGGPGRRALQLLADDGARLRGHQREDRGHRQASSGAVDVADGARGAPRDARHADAQAWRLAEPGQGDQARRPGLAASAAGQSAADPPDAGAMAGRPGVADHGARVRQSRLADLLRHRLGRDQRGSRHAERGAVASRAARLAGRRVHGEGLEAEGPAPDHRDVGGLPAELAHRVDRPREGSLQPAARPGRALPRRGRDRPRRGAGHQRTAEPGHRRQERDAAGAGFSLQAAGELRPSSSGSKRRAPIGIGAPSTPIGGDRRRFRCCRPSTCPKAHRLRPTHALEHAAPGSDAAERDGVRWKRRGRSR